MLREVEGTSSEYQVMIDHLNGRDIMTIFFESDGTVEKKAVEQGVKEYVKNKIGLTIVPMAVGLGELPRSEKKSTRIFDNRY